MVFSWLSSGFEQEYLLFKMLTQSQISGKEKYDSAKRK